VFGLIGVILGVGVMEFRHWREERERYQVMTFEKRLETHQAALNWCYQLNRVLNSRDPGDIHGIADQAREWWNKNCLLLDEKSRESMVLTINFSHSYANKFEHPDKGEPEAQKGSQVWHYLNDSLRAIHEGIGVKYLPEKTEMSKSNVTAQAEVGTETRWWAKASSRGFVIAVSVAVGLMIYGVFLPGLEGKLVTKLGYAFTNLAAIIGLFATYWWVRGKWGKILILAIEFFVIGMFCQLLGIVQPTL
jgi:hypothetical protein